MNGSTPARALRVNGTRLGVLAILVCAAGLFALRAGASVERSASSLPADGTASMTLSVRSFLPLGSRASLTFTEGASLVRGSCGQSADGAACTLVAGVAPGEVKGRVKVVDALGTLADAPFTLSLSPDRADTDGDGFPDVAELSTEEDREAFRRWFAAIAAAQYYRADPAWPAVHRDCAGLLRFAYKEALKPHDARWRAGRGYLPDASMPDVKKYRYPAVPLLGERLFRVAAGRFTPQTDLAADFAPGASAKWLLAENVVPVPPERAAVGDLLFFEDPEAPGMSFHSMVYLADLEQVPGERDWVVYHTGPDRLQPGTVRKVRLQQLLAHPDEKWRPRADNPHFLGFYRWKIAD